jgi:hypothetical protein
MNMANSMTDRGMTGRHHGLHGERIMANSIAIEAMLTAWKSLSVIAE